MTQDRYGQLWISTVDGVNRFDGNHFTAITHRPGDSTSLLDDNVQSVTTDTRGDLWVAYNEAGFSRYVERCQCFRHYPCNTHVDSRPMALTRILLFQGDSVLWYSGIGKGLSKFYIKTGKSVRFDLPYIDTTAEKGFQVLQDMVYGLYRENANNYWLATVNGLYLFHPADNRFEYFKSPFMGNLFARGDGLLGIAPDSNRGFWLFANRGGVNYFDKREQTFSRFAFDKEHLEESFSNEIDAVARKSAYEFWISTEDSGLGVFDTRTRAYYFPGNVSSDVREYNTKRARAIYAAKDSTLFVANNFGLLKISSDKKLFNFRTLPLTKEQNSDHYYIQNILEDTAEHSIFFSTMFANGLNILDTRTNTLTALPVMTNPNKSSNYQMVRNVVPDTDGGKWVVCPYMLYRYDNKARSLITVLSSDNIPDRKTNEYFSNLIIDHEGTHWLQTNRGRLYPFDVKGNKIGRSVNDRPGVPTFTQQVCIDQGNRVWLASDTVCVYYDKRTGKIGKPQDHLFDSLIKRQVNRMIVDTKGNIWVLIADFGLMKLTPSEGDRFSITTIGKAQGLPSTDLYNIGADMQGNIWIAAKPGVLLMKTNPVTFSLFNSTVGMEKNHMNTAFINAGANTFYISASGKYCKVDETVFNSSQPVPQVYIDNVLVLNSPRNFLQNSDQPLVLRPTDNFFSIDFGCIDFQNQASDRFAYKLEGWDKDWVYCDTRRFANYTNLNGGSYTFKVKVANSVGQWGEPVSLSIVILVPFYKKTWFILLLVFVLSAIVYVLYRARIAGIRQTEKLKTEFNRKLNETRLMALRAQMNPHFIFNSLNSINGYVIKNEIKLASYYITKFSRLMRLILDNSVHKRVVLSNELEALRLYIEMEALRFDNKFSFEIIIDDSVNTERIDVPPLLIQPYVENAIWHGLLHKEDGEGKLTISVSLADNLLICEVTDNGIGRKKAMEYKSSNAPTRKSVGMKLTEERLKLREIDAEENGSQEVIDLTNEAGEASGTKVIIKIPIQL